jgi:hypothetical protein
MPYDRHYDDSFLDGLHNYLPDILYGAPEQFGGAAPLISYIQARLQHRLDLFSAARRSFASTLATPIHVPLAPRVRRSDPVDLSELSHLASIANTILRTPQNTNYTALFTGLGPALWGLSPPQQVMEPVIVRPTAEQIATGTSIELVDTDDEMCAICQDSMPSGSEARVINVCDHRFHTGCIDTWFMRDVRCPTCRHDVRTPQ